MSTSPYPVLSAGGSGIGIVSHGGATVLLQTAIATGLVRGLSAALSPWRKALATHDPGKIITALAVAIAMGGDCLADINQVRAYPHVFGSVALGSDCVAADHTPGRRCQHRVGSGRQCSCNGPRRRAGGPGHDRDHRNPVIMDVDATLITAHSDREHATPTSNKGFGFHPLCAFVDHQAASTGEPVAIKLRTGSAGSNTATDRITIVEQALAQILDVS
ncbi:hypothetical protein EF294_08850 [Gordonia oryzae]|uniref:Transposase DDE domain-containing protein n=1 Tax=Gordonia oryzae TaxID=2487349 RepID=A0A3N4GKM6_9ACTN|nr:transposase [Gordonia oryzae]RPA62138.1 hypothetical protein EF294_08850 [Gordonia oryzae]